MEPITAGMQGPAVEDVQTRLVLLGHAIDATELDDQRFGSSTARAVRSFRQSKALPDGEQVDMACWSKLVDASYRLGDRTLYLRLPNFHGADVRELQTALNTLGFSCGSADSHFGPHTEAALQQFQENVGLFADGMAFQDTFSYIDRLRHVWKGKPSTANTDARPGFARAASVLERYHIAVIGEDPIARNVASRMWNIASATTNGSGMVLCDSETPADCDLVLEIASDELPSDSEPRATITLAESSNLAQRIRTAYVAATERPAFLRIELTGMTKYNGTFTSGDAQTLAVRLLDGVCDAMSD
ncbi:Peptidoglycan-binding domain 1 protein [Coriobacterium glomerans PW2]|uniref:Peptidoglycan-binding domain 1 protein n=1 Tax=Coriobacterium glomerans (strain ATCC 49209 / DSM 20642 / JCM 10262 / PW2) TaxID=700015 RepID=F2NAE4_CORGP|nr:peptidoglycan-binding protein [Coriobacterium glomerans]AEB06330.1 Peptidoglycan-binding domain 1 protein [Coriobacterium glomerans PW2]